MEQNKLKITLSNGEVVEAERASYVVQEWNAGKWLNVAVYPPAKDGYKATKKKMNAIDNDYVQIQQFT